MNTLLLRGGNVFLIMDGIMGNSHSGEQMQFIYKLRDTNSSLKADVGSIVYEKLLRSGVGKSPCGLVVKVWLCYSLTVKLDKLLVLSELNLFCEMVTMIVKIISNKTCYQGCCEGQMSYCQQN